MPQLNPEFFTSQIFWVFVILFIYLIVFSKKYLPKISNIIQNRNNYIIKQEQKTKEFNTLEQDLLKQYQLTLKNKDIDNIKELELSKQELQNSYNRAVLFTNQNLLDEMKSIDDGYQNVLQNFDDLFKETIESCSAYGFEILKSKK